MKLSKKTFDAIQPFIRVYKDTTWKIVSFFTNHLRGAFYIYSIETFLYFYEVLFCRKQLSSAIAWFWHCWTQIKLVSCFIILREFYLSTLGWYTCVNLIICWRLTLKYIMLIRPAITWLTSRLGLNLNWLTASPTDSSHQPGISRLRTE